MSKKQLLSVLANPIRLQIIMCLAKRTQNVQELVNTCALSQSAVSQHLAKLRKSGLVLTTRKGKEVFYNLKKKDCCKIAQTLLKFIEKK